MMHIAGEKLSKSTAADMCLLCSTLLQDDILMVIVNGDAASLYI
jgi:hypothetical protein